MKEASTPNAPTEAVSGLALAPGKSIRIGRERLGQHLQRHVPVELGIPRSIHLPHAAFADLGGDLIRADRCHVDRSSSAVSNCEALVCLSGGYPISLARTTDIGDRPRPGDLIVRSGLRGNQGYCYCFRITSTRGSSCAGGGPRSGGRSGSPVPVDVADVLADETHGRRLFVQASSLRAASCCIASS